MLGASLRYRGVEMLRRVEDLEAAAARGSSAGIPLQEIAELKENQSRLQARWEQEKQTIFRLRSIREEIEKTKTAMEQAQREYDLNHAAELKYGKLAQLERQLAEEEKKLQEQGTR